MYVSNITKLSKNNNGESIDAAVTPKQCEPSYRKKSQGDDLENSKFLRATIGHSSVFMSPYS